MSTNEIEAVLFDYGGVFTASPFGAAEGVADKLGLPRATLLDLVFGPYDRDTDHPWHQLERGEVSLDQARKAILEAGRAHDREVDIFVYFAAIASITQGMVEPMIDCARNIKIAGYRTAIVTNNVAEFAEHWRASLPLDELFDTIIDSSQVGMRKPNPKIFHHALECVGNIAPQNAVFLDDFAGNVAAAERVGMHGILVEPDPSGAIAKLESLLAGS